MLNCEDQLKCGMSAKKKKKISGLVSCCFVHKVEHSYKALAVLHWKPNETRRLCDDDYN